MPNICCLLFPALPWLGCLLGLLRPLSKHLGQSQGRHSQQTCRLLFQWSALMWVGPFFPGLVFLRHTGSMHFLYLCLSIYSDSINRIFNNSLKTKFNKIYYVTHFWVTYNAKWPKSGSHSNKEYAPAGGRSMFRPVKNILRTNNYFNKLDINRIMKASIDNRWNH